MVGKYTAERHISVSTIVERKPSSSLIGEGKAIVSDRYPSQGNMFFGWLPSGFAQNGI